MIKFAVNTMLCATHYCTLPFSDGMSRSGVFITCMSEIERVKVEGAIDVFQTVKAARTQRPYMVATHVSREIQYAHTSWLYIGICVHARMAIGY